MFRPRWVIRDIFALDRSLGALTYQIPTALNKRNKDLHPIKVGTSDPFVGSLHTEYQGLIDDDWENDTQYVMHLKSHNRIEDIARAFVKSRLLQGTSN